MHRPCESFAADAAGAAFFRGSTPPSTRWRAATAAWCAALARAWVVVLIFYVALMVFAGWFVHRLPTGFIPQPGPRDPDHLAAVAARGVAGRTDAVLQRATDMVLGDAWHQVFQRASRDAMAPPSRSPPTPA